jgi:CheY-like chemotaxis protein
MLSRPEFTERVTDVYAHLYDIVYLRTHALCDLLVPDPSLSRKQKAWQMHHLLLDVIDELKPEPQVSVLSRQWRRHQLLVLRYVKALEPEAVAEQLTISRRHFYREYRIAMDALADILWDRYVARPTQPPSSTGTVSEQASLERLALLRLEAARVAQADRYARVSQVVGGVLPLLSEMQRQHRLEISAHLGEKLPSVSVERSLLRQMLLGILGLLSEHTENATLLLTANVQEAAICLRIRVEPLSAIDSTMQKQMQERLLTLNEMAALNNARIQAVYEPAACGFDLYLPIAERVVLVVDDNRDVLELFRRYLSAHHYRVMTAETAQQAVEQATRLQPHAVTLDLMMPGQDGWDLLQTLLNQPDTRHIPIIVCSVLGQKELVLSLGAAAFLQKPVTEQELLSALQALDAA